MLERSASRPRRRVHSLPVVGLAGSLGAAASGRDEPLHVTPDRRSSSKGCVA